VVHWVDLFWHDFYNWTHVIPKLGSVTRLGFLVRHRCPCGYNMRLVWVRATVGAKCQQDPTIGTQCRVGTRCGRYGSTYQGLKRYFYVANVSFSCFWQGYIGIGEGHVDRKWDINVLLEKAEQYLGGIKTWNWFYGNVVWRDQQVELRNVATATSAYESVPCIGLSFWFMKCLLISSTSFSFVINTWTHLSAPRSLTYWKRS